MISKRFRWGFIAKAFLLTTVSCLIMALALRQYYAHLFLTVPLLIWLWKKFYDHQTSIYKEVEQFAASVKYQDFSRHFNESDISEDSRLLRRSFNQVFSEIKKISREKEKHYQYLNKILELVDTGIISFEMHTGEVVWINESLKRLLKMPRLKKIDILSGKHPQLLSDILAVNTGKQAISSVEIERSPIKLLLAATVFENEGKLFKVIAIQNVQDALDETESKAWQKLLSVLTHELMNSVAPISSVAKTLNDLMVENGRSEDGQLPVEDIRTGLETIKRRSEGLLRFSETYRNLSKITSLNIETVSVSTLFEDLLILMQPSMQQRKILLQSQPAEDHLRIKADPNLIEQVLINLVMNAMEAVKDKQDAKISLHAKRDANDKVQISVADNGAGIPQQVLDNIFIPFFSTRKNGTGIGLSLCKQIMLLHKGTIQVRSVEGVGSSFTLHFNI